MSIPIGRRSATLNADDEPRSLFYRAHGLRLHYWDWGNDAAPLLVLIHGGRDHGRSWDRLARALRPDFHVVAPDLRGHGDSEWTRGGSYSLPEFVYDLTRLPPLAEGGPAALVGHSMGGMVAMMVAGAFPARVSRLVVLDGVTVRPGSPRPPVHERMTRWIDQLAQLEVRQPRRYPSIEAAAAQMRAHNKRLTPELSLHLARHGVRHDADGSCGWKFDPYQRVAAPHRLSADEYAELWARIACPTLLVFAGESFLGAPKAEDVGRIFKTARIETVAGAGHWLQHDQPDAVLGLVRDFLSPDGA